jgi:Papain-like cysteine protease AvrRpt2
MALTKGYNVTYRWQGLSLHCWLTALEMLMHWRYNNIYGVDSNGANRQQHTARVIQAKARQAPDQVPHFGPWFKAGYSYRKIDDYGLQRAMQLKNTLPSWERQLQARGPILLTGDYGPGQIAGRHCVLAVGISGSNKIAYLDPFLIGRKAILDNHYTYMSPADAVNRLQSIAVGSGHEQQAYQAASGATDPGFGWAAGAAAG